MADVISLVARRNEELTLAFLELARMSECGQISEFHAEVTDAHGDCWVLDLGPRRARGSFKPSKFG